MMNWIRQKIRSWLGLDELATALDMRKIAATLDITRFDVNKQAQKLKRLQQMIRRRAEKKGQ